MVPKHPSHQLSPTASTLCRPAPFCMTSACSCPAVVGPRCSSFLARFESLALSGFLLLFFPPFWPSFFSFSRCGHLLRRPRSTTPQPLHPPVLPLPAALVAVVPITFQVTQRPPPRLRLTRLTRGRLPRPHWQSCVPLPLLPVYHWQAMLPRSVPRQLQAVVLVRAVVPLPQSGLPWFPTTT